jgi:hypothetical protein
MKPACGRVPCSSSLVGSAGRVTVRGPCRTVMCAPIDEEQQQHVSSILSAHERLVDTRKNRSAADPFVIALAMAKGCVVVTAEGASNKPERPNIPDVCSAMEIRRIGLVELFREQGWRFWRWMPAGRGAPCRRRAPWSRAFGRPSGAAAGIADSERSPSLSAQGSPRLLARSRRRPLPRLTFNKVRAPCRLSALSDPATAR